MKRTVYLLIIGISCLAIVGATYWYVQNRDAATGQEEQQAVTERQVDTEPQDTRSSRPPDTTTVEPVMQQQALPALTTKEEVQEAEQPPLPPPIDSYLLHLSQLPFLSLAEQEEPEELRNEPTPQEPEQESEEPVALDLPVDEPQENQEQAPAEELPPQQETPLQEPTSEQPTENRPSTDDARTELAIRIAGPNVVIGDSTKGFSARIGIDRLSGKLGLGGFLVFGMQYGEDTPSMFASLEGNLSFVPGTGTIRFPLGISLGPALFMEDGKTEWGAMANLSAGISYALNDTLDLFASVGMTFRLTFADMQQTWVVEPVCLGIGIRF